MLEQALAALQQPPEVDIRDNIVNNVYNRSSPRQQRLLERAAASRFCKQLLYVYDNNPTLRSDPFVQTGIGTMTFLPRSMLADGVLPFPVLDYRLSVAVGLCAGCGWDHLTNVTDLLHNIHPYVSARFRERVPNFSMPSNYGVSQCLHTACAAKKFCLGCKLDGNALAPEDIVSVFGETRRCAACERKLLHHIQYPPINRHRLMLMTV